MASRSISFRLPPDAEAQFELLKKSLGKEGDSEALVEIIRTYPVAWRPSMSSLFRERPDTGERGPADGSERLNEYLYGPVASRVRREERRSLAAAARKRRGVKRGPSRRRKRR